MGYFEHTLNDYLKVKGEIVVSGMDYDTRDVVGNIDEWDRRSPYGRNVAVAIGSNPGNPFRAFADGSSALGVQQRNGVTQTTSIRTSSGQVNAIVRRVCNRVRTSDGLSRTATAAIELDYVDENGNGVYDYLQEPGEYLLFAQDSDGNGIPRPGCRWGWTGRLPRWRLLPVRA